MLAVTGLLPSLLTAQTLIDDNQSGLESGSCQITGTTANCGKLNYNYVAPDPTHAINVLHAQVVRIPFLVERAQPTASGALDTAGYMTQLQQVATRAINLGAYVVLDPHNYGYVYGNDITTATGRSEYLNFEQRFNTWLVSTFTAAQLVHIGEGLMNEPHAQSDQTYQPVFQSAIETIRAAGFAGRIGYPAASWSNMASISSSSTFMQGVTDPANNLFAELHGYWDANDSGTSDACITDATLGHARMDGAIAWSNRTGIKIFWGETAEPEPLPQPASFSGCYVQSDQYFQSFIQEAVSSGRFIAITLWGDGPWWGSNYPFVLAPVNGQETPDALTMASLIAGGANNPIDPTKWYSVVNTNSKLCLDDTQASQATGTRLVQSACGSDENEQDWQLTPTDSGYYSATSRSAPLVFDVTGGPGATASGTPVQLWGNVHGTNQQWMPVALGNGSYEFVVRNSGLCLDVPSASTASGVQLQQYPCNGTGAQSFSLSQKQ